MKPICGWCAKAGKECEYELPKAASKASHGREIMLRRPLQPKATTISHLSLNLVPGSGKEKRSFEFYVSELGPMLSGSFDIEFWNQLLIQRSCAEPAIWHSVISLSMLHEHATLNSDASSATEVRTSALQHYNKAVGSLNRHTTDAQLHFENLVIACTMFACIEVLLQDPEKAGIHMTSGMKMVQDWKLKSSSAPPYQKKFMEGLMEPIFDDMSTCSLPTLGEYIR